MSLILVISLIETAQAQRKSLPRKSSDLDASLVQGHKQLSSNDAEFSRLSEEEEKLEVEIQRLIAKKKEELLDHKNSVASQLEKTNEKVSKDLSEWKRRSNKQMTTGMGEKGD